MIATSSVSIVNVNDGATGATGPQGVSVTKVVEEYRLSNSSTELTGSGTGYTWSETKPDIPSGKYLWIRERTDLSNNTSSYGTAHCDIVISGLVQDVDRNSGVITSKVWESYTQNSINEYDGSTGAAIRDRVTQTETSITGITSRVSDVESETDSLGTRMTSAESSITQNADNIALMVTVDGTSSSLTLTQNMLTAMTSQFVVKDPQGSATIISGGKIHANAITTAMLATDAIKSTNYQASTSASSPYSATGTFLDLGTGTLYMPNFGVNGTTGEAYFNGTVNANAGKFGDDSSYWNIETVYDYDMQPHAALVGTGSPYLQTGNWQVSDNAVATRKYTSTSDSSGNATYYKDSGTNTFYDVGMKIPSNFSAYSASDSSVTKYNKAFYYGRKYTGNNAPSLDSDWTYFFSIDSGGNVITAGDVYEGGVKLSDKYAAITDVGSAYLPKTGGTITGNLSVNGSFTTNLQLQTNLGSTSSAQLTGAANAVVKPGVTGTLGVGNGGTGKSSWTANQIVYASASNTLSQLGSGTSGQILKSNGSSAPSWVNQSTLSVGSATKATQDGNGNVIVNTYMPIAGGQFTGAVYVPDEFSADSAQLGSLIVNGAARFTNDVFADTFTGNLVGTASNAVEFSSNQSVSLTGDTTGSASSKAGWSVTTTTNKLTYQPQLTTQAAIDGFIEASKFMVATFKTTDANNIGMASNDGMIMSLAWGSTAYGSQIALDDTASGALKFRGRASSVWGDWRTVIHDGNYTNYTVTKSGTGASGTWGISISGNAATATTATKAIQDSVGNQINTYYTPISYMPYRSGRDFVDGTLIVTDLSGGTKTCSIPFLLKIVGNGYNNGFVETYVQGYVYHLDDGYTTYISTDAFSNSKTFASKIYAFKNSDGYLSFWFERMSYWQGFDVQCYDTSENMHTTKTVNHVTSVINSVFPSTRSYTTEINVRQGLSSSNYHNYTVKKDGTGATGTWVINITGTASKLATARTISLTGSVTGSVSFDGSGDVSISTTTNHTHNYAGSNSAGGALSTGVAWAAGTDNVARRVWFSNTNSTNTVAYPVYDDDFKYNPSTNVLTVGSISGSAAYLTTGRTLTIGNTGKTFNGSSDVSWTKADISANATTSASGWMSSDDKTKLNGIQAGAQVNTITGVKGGSETDYRIGNVNITASNIGLGNVTNNKQVKGLASGTISGHLVSWGSDGYTVADSGVAVSSVNKTVKSLASNNDGKIVLTYLDGTTSDPIEVKIIGSSGSSVSYADALNVNGTAVGGAEQPVFINNQGKPQTANKIPKLNNGTTGGTFYAPTSTGTANQVLVSSGTGAPTWTNQSSLSVGTATNATNATTASKADKLTTGRTISLTGDVTGSTTFDGSGNVSITATVADNSHYHTVTNITTGNSSVQSGLDPITATMIGSAASNKTFGLPANAITIQYSTNGGSTWTDYGASDAQKKALFAETRGFGPILGKSSSASTNTVNNQLRVIIEPTDRYVSLHGIYVWMSSNGNTCVMDLERSTIGAKDTFTSVFTNQPISGWSGNNIRYFSSGTFGGGASQTGNFYKYRITFKQTAVNTSYNSAQIIDIRFIGNNVWSSPNTMVSKNHMYTWDENLNVTFPANITANAFVGALSGNATTATKFASNQSVTLTGDVTGTASSQAGWSISTTLSNSGVTADSYGPSANASPSHGGTFSVPYITVDAKGRITSASTKTITLPLSGNTDTKVTQTAVTASSYTYWRPLIFGSSNSATEGFSPSTVTDQVYATSTLSVQPSSGTIRATTFKGNLSGTATYSNYPNLVSINEIRFNNKPSDATDIHIGYKWADGTSDAKINSYKFENGNAALTNVYANTFYGALSGNASTSTKWASAQTVYVALGTASKTTSIQGGNSSAVTLGVDGVLGVANGGTGAASFTANSLIMSGSSTTGAFTTRGIRNNTSVGTLGWTSATADVVIPTVNTIAYWNGAYNSTNSNLAYCNKGAFGTAATYSATTSVTSGSSALVTSGGVSSALGNYVTLSTAQTISGAKTFSAVTSITNTTASTSKSTGALKVSGGVGISGQMSANTVMIDDAVSLVYDSSISALCFQFD